METMLEYDMIYDAVQQVFFELLAHFIAVVIVLLSFSAFFFVCLLASTSCHQNGFAFRKPRAELVIAGFGAVVTDSSTCSNIGRDVLANGGHAVDAAVASALCLGVVDPPFSGLGGGGFMLVRQASGEAKVFDMKETAPKRASQDMYNRNPAAQIRGHLSIAVPGQLAGLHTAWKRYGKLPWDKLLTPAENLARNGFKISKYLHQVMVYEALTLTRDPMLRSIFTNGKRPLKPGDTIYQETLANTLAEIGRNGITGFYNGSIGRSLVNDIARIGGILSVEDLQRYVVKIREPVKADAMGIQIITAPPPASGGSVTILVLKIMEQYGLPSGVYGALGTHRFIEALKYALAMRMELGDPDFVNINSTLSAMLSTGTAKKLRNMINDSTTYPSDHYRAKWKQLYDQGTTHICVVDKERNVVSMTSSLNSIFGSAYMSPSTGIILNNHMLDFSIPAATVPPPSPSNFIRPNKRPLSSMAPTIILKGGRLKAVIGAAGGILIPDAVIQVLLNHLVGKMDPLSSVMAPRYYHRLNPNVLNFENYTWMGDKYRVPKETIKFLGKRNHKMYGDTARSSCCQFIVEEWEGSNSGKLLAVADPRKGGLPAGY